MQDPFLSYPSSPFHDDDDSSKPLPPEKIFIVVIVIFVVVGGIIFAISSATQSSKDYQKFDFSSSQSRQEDVAGTSVVGPYGKPQDVPFSTSTPTEIPEPTVAEQNDENKNENEPTTTPTASPSATPEPTESSE